jgi:hypothetical protein
VETGNRGCWELQQHFKPCQRQTQHNLGSERIFETQRRLAPFNENYQRFVSFHYQRNKMAATDISKKKSCGSTMGDIISSVSYRYHTKDCDFNDEQAMSELFFDGSKNSLMVALGNCSAQKALRDYGLPRLITNIVRRNNFTRSAKF